MTMTAAVFFSHFFHYFYVPTSGPWYAGNVWGNVFVIAIVAPLGWLWAKSKFWPLIPIQKGIHGLHERHDEHKKALEDLTQSVQLLHDKHDKLAENISQISSKPKQ
jgi:hypothetical protein